MANPNDQIQLCCLLWAHPGQEAALTAYEDRVLALVPEYGGAVLQRAVSGRNGEGPHRGGGLRRVVRHQGLEPRTR